MLEILQEIEMLIVQAAKAFLKKDLNVSELQVIYTIFRDLKIVINSGNINGNINDESKKQA